MASLSNAKVLGGVGGILALFPGIAVVGWILILISQKEVADASQDKSILRDGVIGGIMAIISAITITFFLVSGAFIGVLASLVGASANFGPGGAAGAIATFGVFYASVIISGIFLKRAYDKTAQHLKVGAFATAGLLYLIGGLTAIIAVGFLIFFIAFIYQIIAYFSIQDQPTITYYGVQLPQPVPAPLPQTSPSIQPSQPQPTPPPQPIPSPTPSTPTPPQGAQPQEMPPQQPVREFKFCFRCGTRVPFAAVYCSNCGVRQ